MKRIFVFALCLLMLATANPAALAAPKIDAQAAVLIEAGTCRVIYSQNAQAQLPMASTTKIMTALLAIEQLNLDEIITVPPNASGVEGSSMYLETGEKLTVKDLLLGLMLVSGNDAAVALAMRMGGSVEGFAQIMNQRARELGCTNTNFVTPNGLPNDNHFTTAHDLAVIAAKAMSYPQLVEIINTPSHEIPWPGHQWNRVLRNKNKLLKTYDGANGIKTGFTKKAGRCLISAARRDELQLVGVVLNCPGMYVESAKLLDYGFETLEARRIATAGELMRRVPIENGLKESLDVTLERDIIIPMRKDGTDRVEKKLTLPSALTAPVEQGQLLGKVEYLLNGQPVASQEFFASESVEEITLKYYLEKIFEQWNLSDRIAP